jgi:hypothetical protein
MASSVNDVTFSGMSRTAAVCLSYRPDYADLQLNAPSGDGYTTPHRTPPHRPALEATAPNYLG